MKVLNVSIDSITPYDNNPRNNEDAVRFVAESIKEFGWQQPIVVDRDGVVIVGHTRLLAAREIGCEEVPVIYADELSEEQVRAYRLADNKTGEIAEWDFIALGEELDKVFDIDMSDFGFSDITEDEYGEDFSLDDSDAPRYKTMTLSMTQEEFDIVESVLELVPDDECTHTGGNIHGDKVCEVCLRWAQKTSK